MIAHVNVSNQPVSLGWDEVQQWQDGVLAHLLAAGLLRKEVKAQSLMCMGCEQQCFMPVYLTDDGQRAFIVCDDPDKQAHMGRVNVPLVRLQQWQTSTRQFAGVVADMLGLDANPEYQEASASYRLGMLKSEGGRRWVSISVQLLVVEINRQAVPLADLLYFSDDVLVMDQPRIDELLNVIPSDTGKAYMPDATKREARKLATQARYRNWHDEYLLLQRKHPGKSDTWYSLQISKLPIAQGKGSETIRKNMKKVK
jgi:hypothetical protein